MTERARHRQPLEVVQEAPDTPVGEHTHEQPRSALLTVLTIVVVLLSLTVGWLLFTTYMLQKGQAETTAYIEGRGAARDAENQRLNDRVDQAVCDVLDQLPAGGLFDPIREQYRCGPGIPLGELDPQAAQNLAEILEGAETPTPAAPTTQPQATSAPDEVPPGAPPGAQPTPMGQAPTTTAAPTPAPVTPAPTAAPTSTAPPLVDLSTVTDGVCGAVGICL